MMLTYNVCVEFLMVTDMSSGLIAFLGQKMLIIGDS